MMSDAPPSLNDYNIQNGADFDIRDLQGSQPLINILGEQGAAAVDAITSLLTIQPKFRG
jgi:hypothetical protein